MRKRRLLASVPLLAAVGLAAATAAAGGSRAAVSAQDETWLKTSAQGDVFEIQGGRLALRTTQSATVRRSA